MRSQARLALLPRLPMAIYVYDGRATLEMRAFLPLIIELPSGAGVGFHDKCAHAGIGARDYFSANSAISGQDC